MRCFLHTPFGYLVTWNKRSHQSIPWNLVWCCEKQVPIVKYYLEKGTIFEIWKVFQPCIFESYPICFPQIWIFPLWNSKPRNCLRRCPFPFFLRFAQETFFSSVKRVSCAMFQPPTQGPIKLRTLRGGVLLDLDLPVRCLEKVKTYSLKWWWKMVTYHGRIRKKSKTTNPSWDWRYASNAANGKGKVTFIWQLALFFTWTFSNLPFNLALFDSPPGNVCNDIMMFEVLIDFLVGGFNPSEKY